MHENPNHPKVLTEAFDTDILDKSTLNKGISGKTALDEEALCTEMRSGALYNDANPDLRAVQTRACQLLEQYNRMSLYQKKERVTLLETMCAECGSGCWIEPPLYSNWGCHQLHLGDGVYFNFGCKLVDDGDIYIHSHVMIGPGVTLISGSHPIQPQLRKAGLQFTAPITIEENAWIGAGAIVMPGITIGKDAIIGAGSVVTRDIPAGVIAAGNPCRVLRRISDKDDRYYFQDRSIDWDIMEERFGIDAPTRS